MLLIVPRTVVFALRQVLKFFLQGACAISIRFRSCKKSAARPLTHGRAILDILAKVQAPPSVCRHVMQYVFLVDCPRRVLPNFFLKGTTL